MSSDPTERLRVALEGLVDLLDREGGYRSEGDQQALRRAREALADLEESRRHRDTEAP